MRVERTAGTGGRTVTRVELREMIASGENSGVDFERDGIDGRSLAAHLVAFANSYGGRVLLGVDQQGNVRGLTRSDRSPQARTSNGAPHVYGHVEEWVRQACRDRIRPVLVPRFDVVPDAAPGRDVLVIGIEPSWGVHHVRHNQHRTFYVRVGSASREASREQVEMLFRRQAALRLERRPVSGTSFRDLDRRRVEDYFERVREQEPPAAASQAAGWTQLLVNTWFLDEDDPHPATLAGLLLFGADPGRYLPHARMDAVAFVEPRKGGKARERRSLRGPLVPLVGAGGALLEPGLVEQAMEFVRRNVETVRLQDGVRREQRWDFSPDAVREAIVNAVVHRDYSLSGTDIELGIYSDRLEVVSPGRLANGMTPENMRAGCRRARNQLLKDVMRDYGYLERMGMGVPRKIVRGMREHNGTEPDLVEDGERFTVRLWKEARANRP